MKFRSWIRPLFYSVTSVLLVGILLGAAYVPVQPNPILDDVESLAHKAIRVIATIQGREHFSSGRFLSLDEIARSEHLKNLKMSVAAEVRGLGTSTIRQMSFGEEELVPGYKVFFRLASDNSAAYTVALLANDETNRFSVATDQDSVVYHGTQISGQLIGRESVIHAKALLANPQTLCEARAKSVSWRNLTRSVASLNFTASAWFDYGCPADEMGCDDGSACCFTLDCANSSAECTGNGEEAMLIGCGGPEDGCLWCCG